MMSKYLFTKKVKLKDKRHFQWENGIWTGNERPLIKINILRNTNFNENGFFDFKNVAEIEIEERNLPRKLLRRNDILIERSGGGPNTPVGRAAFYDGEDNLYSFSNFTSRVRIVSDEIDPEYLHKYLLYLHWNKQTEKIQTQTTNIRNLEFEKYLSFEVLLPETKKDQQTINDYIKDKFATVEQMRQAALKQKEAVEALQGGLLREAFPYKSGDELPEGWRWEKLKGLAEIVNGSTPSTDESTFWNGNILWATPTDVGKLNSIFLSDTQRKITQEGFNSCSTKFIPPNNILMTSRAPVGNLAINTKTLCTN